MGYIWAIILAMFVMPLAVLAAVIYFRIAATKRLSRKLGRLCESVDPDWLQTSTVRWHRKLFTFTKNWLADTKELLATDLLECLADLVVRVPSASSTFVGWGRCKTQLWTRREGQSTLVGVSAAGKTGSAFCLMLRANGQEIRAIRVAGPIYRVFLDSQFVGTFCMMGNFLDADRYDRNPIVLREDGNLLARIEKPSQGGPIHSTNIYDVMVFENNIRIDCVRRPAPGLPTLKGLKIFLHGADAEPPDVTDTLFAADDREFLHSLTRPERAVILATAMIRLSEDAISNLDSGGD